MRFGLVLACQHPTGDNMSERLAEHLQQVHLAGTNGFDGVFCGEHFLMTPYQQVHQMTFLGRVAAEAGEMHVGSGIFLLALHNPVEAADMAATLDVITRGRFIFGVGLGYRDAEFAAFHVPRQEAARRFEERLAIIRRLWQEENIDYEGPDFTLRGATCTLRPVQKPHPPIWIAANNHGAVRRAARLGDAWYINPHARLAVLEEQIALYRTALAAAGKPSPAVLPMMKEIFVAETREKAVQLVRPYLEQKFKVYLQWGQDKALPQNDPLDLPFDALAQERFIIGSPDDVIRGLETYRQRLGVNFVVCHVQWPGMSHEMAAGCIELLGRHVIPHFRRQSGASQSDAAG